ncbi:hypothetical protein VTP01DRAFT_9661 [Rhizomucor pusillus]|uniref:uncharacterized protein n=1 Tax=Rhizomucor pusillus TaxID=4840 RepID=UPI00374218E1
MDPRRPSSGRDPRKAQQLAQEEIARRQAEENNARQAIQTAVSQANATSLGFYVTKVSKFNNALIPVIPRK